MKKELLVGMFFSLAMGILGYFTITMSDSIFKRTESYYISIKFRDVEGLSVNDKVRINGVLSGAVSDMQLNIEENSVSVKLKMFNKFTLYKNYKIKIKNENMLVGKFISIYPGTQIENNKRIEVLSMDQTLNGESQLDLFAVISNLVEENRENVSLTIRNLKDITDKINTGKGTLGKLINDNKVYDNADDLIKELKEVIEDTREQAPITSFIRAALLAF